MKSSASYKIRFAILVVGGAFSTYCGCAGDSSSDNVSTVPRTFVFLNAANGVPTARAQLQGFDGSQQLVAQNVAFGTLSAPYTVVRNNTNLRAVADGASGAFSDICVERPVGFFNLIAATQLGTVDNVEMATIDYNDTHVGIGIVHDWSTNLDAYITAPGASIAAVEPDEEDCRPGYVEVTPMETLHPNTNYQLRLCTAGTKNVIFDTGTLSGSAVGTVQIIMAVRSGATKLTRQFIVDPKNR